MYGEREDRRRREEANEEVEILNQRLSREVRIPELACRSRLQGLLGLIIAPVRKFPITVNSA